MKIGIVGPHSTAAKALILKMMENDFDIVQIGRSEFPHFIDLRGELANFALNLDYLIFIAHDYSSKAFTYPYEDTYSKLIENCNSPYLIYVSSMSAYQSNLSKYSKTKMILEEFFKERQSIVIRPGWIYCDVTKIDMDQPRPIANLLRFLKYSHLSLYYRQGKEFHLTELSRLAEFVTQLVYKPFRPGTFDVFHKTLNNTSEIEALIYANRTHRFRITLPIEILFPFKFTNLISNKLSIWDKIINLYYGMKRDSSLLK